MSSRLSFFLGLALMAGMPNVPAFARYSAPQETGLQSDTKPREFDGIGITEKLGASMNLDVTVTDEYGQKRQLKEFFQTGKPSMFSLVYFNCSGLCNLHLNGVFDAMTLQRWKPGRDFEYVVLSFDARENSEMAATKKANYLKQFHMDDLTSNKGIHFLTADQAAIGAITQNVGFSYKWLEDKNDWAHASAAILVTPAGVVSRYLHGVMFDPKSFEIGLGEVAQGKLGSVVDKLIWYCFKYDHQQSKYTVYAVRIMQLGAIATILILMMMVLPYLIRTRWSKIN